MQIVSADRTAISNEGPARRSGEPQRSTLLALVWDLQAHADSADEVVETAATLVNSGEVVLTGNFRGQRLDVDVPAVSV